MSRNAPVPVRSSSIERPPVVVLDTVRPNKRQSPVDNPLARFALSVAPDLLRAVERSVSRRNDARQLSTLQPVGEKRTYTSGMNFSEYDVDVRLPFVRHVTVRKATAWATDAPSNEPVPVATPSLKRRAGVVGIGGVLALTALGLIANRASALPGVLGRRN